MISGKGESIWDRMVHERPDIIVDGTNGDIACDSFHRFEEDVQHMKSIGVRSQIIKFNSERDKYF